MLSRDDREVGTKWECCSGGCRWSVRCAIVQAWDTALCWSLWSSAWGLAYVSQEHGDICAIIYSQQIRWEAQGLLREGIIWEPKDQPGEHWAHRTFSSKKRHHKYNTALFRRGTNTAIRRELQRRQCALRPVFTPSQVVNWNNKQGYKTTGNQFLILT